MGLQCVDQNWWQGQRGSDAGIFPTTHVIELPSEPSAAVNAPGVPNVTHQCGPPTESGISNGTILAKARANIDLTAQLDDELCFTTGDIISVIEVIDEDFAIGECNGKVGQFPLFGVEIFEGSIETKPIEKKEKRKSKFRWWEAEEQVPSNTSSSEPIPQPAPSPSYQPSTSPVTVPPSTQTPPVQQESQVNESILRNKINNQETGKTGNHVDNLTKYSHRRTGSYTAQNTRSYDSEVTPYGKSIYPFLAENLNELTFTDNEIVKLIRYIDHQWMEGEIDGKRGLFPISYVEIIVDCAHTDDSQLNSTNDEVQDRETKSQSWALDETDSELELYGRVLFDFKAETNEDLDMREGDTITVIRKLNDNWFQAMHDDGRIGLCPVNFVELIPSEPPSTPVTPSKNNSNLPTSQPGEAPALTSPSELPTSSKPINNDALGGACRAPESLPAVGVEKKPSMKPKPQLKPKPAPKPKPAGLAKNQSVGVSKAASSSKPSIAPRRSVDVQEYKPPESVAKPQSRKVSAPVFSQRTISTDISLDDVIKSEMKLAVDDASCLRSHSSSAPSDSSQPKSIEGEEAKSPNIQIQEGDNGTRSSPDMFQHQSSTHQVPINTVPEEPYMRDGKIIGHSTFFNTSATLSSSPVVPGRSASRRNTTSQPTPASVGRTVTAPSKRPPPPRPMGPRPAPVPSRTPLIPTPEAESEYGPRPVPQRAAPPRPSQAPGRTPPRSKSIAPGDLMDFSPEKVEEGKKCSTLFYS